MNWVEKRAKQESDIRNAWFSLLTDMEDAVASFDKLYATHQQAEARSYRHSGYFRAVYEPRYPTQREAPSRRSIDVRLDFRGMRTIATMDDKDVVTLLFNALEDGTSSFVDAQKQPLTNDQASQLLLEQFMFPEWSVTALEPLAAAVQNGAAAPVTDAKADGYVLAGQRASGADWKP
jgi:hypothetical protein